MFLCIGLYLTIGTRFFQIRRFGDIIYNTIGSIFHGKTSNDEDSKKARLSSYDMLLSQRRLAVQSETETSRV